jgi:hypothetical protein
MVYALARASAFFLYLMDYAYRYICVQKHEQNNNTTATCGKWDRVLERGIGEKIWGSICLCVYGVYGVCVCVCVWLRRVCVCVCACLLK